MVDAPVTGDRADKDETWDLWIPEVGATGLSFARILVDSGSAGGRVLVHAAPPKLEVTIRDEDGSVVATGAGLERGASGPMTYLVRDGDQVRLEDGWPNDDDLGRLVILPGGETGVLTQWWHAEDRSELRWQVEFTNAV
ncbi:MAG: hypothetical protein ABI807_13020 [Sporichthyaceae bacterium]